MSLPTWLTPFFSLSYPTRPPAHPDSFPDSSYYDIGLLDLCLIVTCIAVMAVLRDIFRIYFFEPLAARVLNNALEHKMLTAGSAASNGKATNGHFDLKKEQRKIHRSVLRFAEQGWPAVYYPLQWCFGLYIHNNVPSDVWKDYPHIPLPGPLKFYYLLQTSFYTHQMLILNAEARRKDHWQMMLHHIITVFLMGTSYTYNFTRVGCLIMVIMDWCDIFFPIAKMMRYLNVRQVLVDTMFAWFLVSWIVTRHGLFLHVIVAAIIEVPKIRLFKWDPSSGCYLTYGSYIMFCSSLLALQALQLLWTVTISRVAWRVLTTNEGASDDRSDDETPNEDKDK